MPRFDGTGPLGAGSVSGRGFGPCGDGYGWGRRFSFRRGWRNLFGGLYSPNPQPQSLADYRKTLEEELEEVKKEEERLNRSK